MTLNEAWNEIIDETITQIKAVSELADTVQNNGFNSTTQAEPVGFLRVVQFTGLQPGDFIDSFSLDVNTAAGNIRIKIYGDKNNSPDVLLGEGNSVSVSSTGVVNFRLIKQVEVPSDGMIWCAFENDNVLLVVVSSSGEASGTFQFVAHTFGPGPDPFGTSTSGTIPFWCELHTNASVVKHWGMRGTQPEDFFVIVSAGIMDTGSYTNRGSINNFNVMIDLSYRGVDYRDGLTKTLKVASDIYDILHRTTLNGKVRQCDVLSMNPTEIEQGKNLYLTGLVIMTRNEKAVIQS